ncbi:HAD family hydrolase [Hazenella sp. IB182357]|uniref:HAD family hydrolase n=1 Tax=Polycladospora coralii TaxID=2771432 RepID=A0A926RTN5_9BACL|nr:HAD family hydrolase [Polycladospora coralii]MBD1373035.1 HAD family hydrolase [Polycladospora coralii]MBS7529621.1 HAD family hydrolase [Polycladospora coralii]
MIKLFVSDLDHTLWLTHKTINPQDRKAVQSLSQNNIALCLASGRMNKEMNDVMHELGVPLHRISQNGAFLHTAEQKCLYRASFQDDIVHKMYHLAHPFDIHGFISVEDHMYIPERTQTLNDIIQEMQLIVDVHPTLLTELGRTVYPSKVSFFGPVDQLKAFEQLIQGQFPGLTDSFMSDTHCMDFMPPHISKGNTLQRLLQHLDLKADEVACIGDSHNDISMLRLTPHSYVMASASPEVLQVGQYIVNSVSDAIEHFTSK